MRNGTLTSSFAGTSLTCVRGERVVFTGLDFSLNAGDALILLGPNGSGKSSLLRLMAGLIRPAAGELSWNGEAVAADRERHAGRIHYVGHHDAIKPVLTVIENLAFWARLHGAESDDKTDAALERLGLDHLAGTPGKLLSAGQKRRLNLARLLAAPAPLWLLDEPSVALDRASVRVLEEIIAEHRAGGGMVAVSTHADIDLPGGRELQMADYAVTATWNAELGTWL
ncbi:MAG: heme ABC exporter ATP-binding protein CcmA [Rhodospirillales bacterium]|nr:heme ABC exporter ATP-binding protein CcmA [Rhodospirillales bacterium]